MTNSTFFHDGYKDGFERKPESPPEGVHGDEYRKGYSEGQAKRSEGVHASHCCVEHGCKYGDKNCPVVQGMIEQKHPCEDCEPGMMIREGYTSLDQICALARRRIEDFKAHYLEGHAKYPEQWPLELENGNAGVWLEQVCDFIINGRPENGIPDIDCGDK